MVHWLAARVLVGGLVRAGVKEIEKVSHAQLCLGSFPRQEEIERFVE
jgi:hypothetical protein